MLSGVLLAQFSQRDHNEVARSLPSIAKRWKFKRWLGKRNRYADDCVNKLIDDLGPAGTIRHIQLREYIAASTMIHCVDGWSYLSRALAAQLVGDHDCARHLGYYAELRAAMGILAGHGIGVFDREHVVTGVHGNCVRVGFSRTSPNKPSGLGTHRFVWDALESWAGSIDAKDAILYTVRAGGKHLADWLSQWHTSALTSKLASDWLVAWGLDIKRLAEDRAARNVASYRPSNFSANRPPSVVESVRSITRMWKSCEPTTDSPFAALDRELVRACVGGSFRATVSRRASPQSRQRFKLRIQGLLSSLQPSPVPGIDWNTFLTDETRDSESVLTMAAGRDGPQQSMHSLQVACRALLLLRVTTGVCDRLIRKLSAQARTDLGFWVDQIGEDRSLWPAGGAPAQLNDLWKDPEDAIGEINGVLPSISSHAQLWQTRARSLSVLSGMERAALWGMCG